MIMNTELIDIKNFILATRDSGYKNTASAVSELIDNSIDAGASTIRIQITKIDNEFEVVVEDDGKGMDGFELSIALKFGGSTKFNQRSSTGRFGMGLPNASLSQARRIDIYSWTGNDNVYWNYLDVDEIAHGKMKNLNPSFPIFKVPFELKSKSGTIVRWTRCDRIEYKNLKFILAHLHRELGRIFRRAIIGGTSISINGKNIEPIDPLFQLQGNNIQGGIDYGESMQFDIKIPGTENSSSKVIVRFVELPLEKWHMLSNEQKSISGITKRAGVSILRSGREIDYGWFFMGSKRKENYDDWWRCEISFDPEIDELFGVTHTKQEIHPTDYLNDLLSPDIEQIARKLNSRVRDRFIQVKSQNLGQTSIKEVEKVDHYIKPPKLKTQSTKEPESERELLFKKEIIRGLTYYLKLKHLTDLNFFQTEFNKEEISVFLNKNHPFYDRVYLPLVIENNSDAQDFLKQLEILIFAAARSESLAEETESLNSAINYRKDWGKILATFLS
jgi:hypothetical protein